MTRAPISGPVVSAALALLVSGSSALAQVNYTAVMTDGQAAPGYGPGATIRLSGSGGSNAAGQVPIEARVFGPGITDPDGASAVYRWTNGTLDLIARTGDAAPQLGAGATFGSVGLTSILPDGTVVYYASTAGTGGAGVDPQYSQWTAPPATAGPEQPIIRTGGAAPGLPGATLASFYWVDAKPGGYVSWASELAGAGFDQSSAIFGGPLAAPTVLVRGNTQAPAMPTGVVLKSFSFESYHASGDLLFAGDYEGIDVGFGNGPALWRRDPAGNFSVLARGGDQAAEAPAGYRYGRTFDGMRLDDGNLLVRADLYGPGDSEIRDQGIWIGPANDPHLVFLTGQTAPDVPGAQLSSLSTFAPLNNGRFVFSANLVGPGVTPANGAAIWEGPLDDLKVIWRLGDAAPGLDGVVTGGFTFQYDDAGNCLLLTTLAGQGVTESNDEAMFLLDAGGGAAHLLAREGDTLDIDGVTWSIDPSGSLSPGHSGLVTTWISRDDGNGGTEYGMVVASVPEPATASAAIVVGAMLTLRRSRRGTRQICL